MARLLWESKWSQSRVQAEIEAALDPNLKPVADAPPLPEDVPLPPPAWMQELIEEMNEASGNPSPEEWRRMQPAVPPEHKAIHARAKGYAMRTYRWLAASEGRHGLARIPAHEVISWFHTVIDAKIYRSLATIRRTRPSTAMGPRGEEHGTESRR